MVLVRQLEPGSCGQIPFAWRRGEPLLNAEAVGERLFWALVTGADVTSWIARNDPRVMPWKATGPGDMTILRAPGRRLAKLVTRDGVIDYDRAAVFEPEAVRIDNVEDIAELLERPRRPARHLRRSAACSSTSSRPALVLRRCTDRPGVAGAVRRGRRAPGSWSRSSLPAPARRRPGRPRPGRRRAAPAPAGAVPASRAASSSCRSQAGLKPGLRAHLWFCSTGRSRAPSSSAGSSTCRASTSRSPARPAPLHRRADLRAASTIRASTAAGARCRATPRSRSRTCRTGLQGKPSPPAPLRRPACAAADRRAPRRYAAACLRRLALAPEGRRHPTCVAVSLPAAGARQGRPARSDPRRRADQGRDARPRLRRAQRPRPQRGRPDPRRGRGRRSSPKDCPMADDAALPDFARRSRRRMATTRCGELPGRGRALSPRCRRTSTTARARRRPSGSACGSRMLDADVKACAPQDGEATAGRASRSSCRRSSCTPTRSTAPR